MTKKSKDRVKTGNITVKLDGKVVLDMSVTARGSFLKNFLSGLSTGASSVLPNMASMLQGGCGGFGGIREPLGTIKPLSMEELIKKYGPPDSDKVVQGLSKEELDELFKKYGTPEEK